MANENMIKDLFKTAMTTILTTALGVFVTFYATNAVNKDKQREENSEKAKQQKDATSKVDDRIIEYEKKIGELEGRLASMGGQVDQNYGVGISNNDINGTWHTSDGSINWVFNNGNVSIGGAGAYNGILSAEGTYAIQGNAINGTVTTSVILYISNTQMLTFSLTHSSKGTLTGTITEAGGSVSSAVLYKN